MAKKSTVAPSRVAHIQFLMRDRLSGKAEKQFLVRNWLSGKAEKEFLMRDCANVLRATVLQSIF